MDVIATALVSAIGYDAPTVCAAVRAGVTRAGPLPFVTLENDESPGVAVGHAARLLTDGFEGDARLVRLLSGAFVDLLARLDERVLGTAHVAYYLSLPPADREWQGLALLGSDEAQARYLDWVGPAPVVDEVRRAARVVDQSQCAHASSRDDRSYRRDVTLRSSSARFRDGDNRSRRRGGRGLARTAHDVGMARSHRPAQVGGVADRHRPGRSCCPSGSDGPRAVERAGPRGAGVDGPHSDPGQPDVTA